MKELKLSTLKVVTRTFKTMLDLHLCSLQHSLGNHFETELFLESVGGTSIHTVRTSDVL